MSRNNAYELPDKLNNFNVYDGKYKLTGVASEITLPSLDPQTDTLNVAGMAGEIESEVIGSYGSMKLEIAFVNMCADLFAFAASTEPVVIRGSQEVFNTQTQAKDSVPIVITVKGRTTHSNPPFFSVKSKIFLSLSYNISRHISSRKSRFPRSFASITHTKKHLPFPESASF